ncbi:MAG: hypothetical protein P9G45_15080 [Candidatus Contendobacter sp.]|nr:hypothetical protein [Candidatus Contendobacter sp.]
MRPPLRYRHTQFATAIVAPLLLVAVLAAGVGGLTGVMLITVIGPALMAVFLVLFYALTVEIDAAHLLFRFGVGLIRKRVLLAEIVDVQPVRNSWLYGWGIHRTPRGWLYNVSGWEAVEITLTSGERLRLGTDEPQKLAQVLRAAQSGR